MKAERKNGAGSSARLGPALAFLQELWALEHGLDAHSKASQRRLGVTGPQRLLLRMIARLGPMPPGRLAALAHVHPASVTRLAKALERRKLLRRRPDPADGRRLLLDLGPAAERLGLTTEGATEAAIRHALAASSEQEINSAVALVSRITAELRAG